jgi:hypothetical protein
LFWSLQVEQHKMPAKIVSSWFPNSFSGDIIANRFDKVFYGSKSGTKVYGWRKKIKDGSNAGSPFTSDRYFVDRANPIDGYQTVVYTNYDKSFTYATYGLHYDGFVADLGEGDFAHLGGVSADAEAQALSRMYDRIRSESYGANGLLFLGELRETIHLIRHPLSTLEAETKKYIRALKSARRDVARRVVRRKSDTDRFFVKRRLDAVKNAVSGTWLEFQFGVKPLFSDIAEIASTAIDQIYGRDDKIRLRAKSTDKVYKAEAYSFGVPWTYGVGVKSSYDWTTKAGVQYVVGMKRTLDAPTAGLGYAASRFGFQIQNFVPTAYELMPYSFLIDYFVNVGDVLEAACTDTSNVSWIVRTQRQVTTKNFREEIGGFNFAPRGDPDFWTKSQGGKLDSLRTARHVTTQRTIPDSLGLPPLVVSMPGIDSSHWLNMAALLGQSRGFRFK